MPEEITQLKEANQPSYEELAQAYTNVVNDKRMQEAQTRLGFCIEILKLKKEFPAKYIKGIVKDIMTILPVEGVDIEKELSKKKAKETEE